jgi:hypothetical protein
MIFKWYRNDFKLYAKEHFANATFFIQWGRRAVGALLADLDHFANDSLQKDLRAARQYAIETTPYDWQLNNSIH